MTMKKILALLMVASLAACARHEANTLTPLMAAAVQGDLGRARALLAAGADVNEKRGVHAIPGMAVEGDNPSSGETALLFAIESNQLDMVRVLLAAGARVDVKDSARRPVWYYLGRAIGKEQGTSMAQLLMSLPAAPVVDYDFMNARMTARRAGNDELVRMMSDYLRTHQPPPCPSNGMMSAILCGRQI